MHIPELLIPAGDLEKLRTAVRFGADAVYVGGGAYNLRAADTGFTLEELEVGVRFAHEHGVKVYLALNIFPYDSDVKEMLQYVQQAAPLGIDAVIVADPGIVLEIQQRSLGVNIHLSTQSNTTNSSSVRFWKNQGVSRIVLARELNLLQIGEIHKNIPDVELEVFIHGAMCLAYSGRCLLSKQFTGRHSNYGECVHPCRWKYFLTEEEDSSRQLEVETSEHGSYIFNAKDLCMIDHIPALIASGVHSFKVEGRMKTPYYTAVVTKIYREAIDSYCTDPEHYVAKDSWRQELENVSHRPYSTGFYFGDGATQDYESLQHEAAAGYIKKYDFVGTVISYDAERRAMQVQVRNRIRLGDRLEVVDPHAAEIRGFTVDSLTDSVGRTYDAVHNQYTAIIPCPFDVSPYSFLRVPRTQPIVSDAEINE